MKITLKDIADRANVSISSVSRALNGTQSAAQVNEQTRQRILQAAKELGYHKISASLRPNENVAEKRIGLFLHHVKDKYQDPYFSEIIYGIESELLDHGGVLDFTCEVNDIFDPGVFSGMNMHNLGVICLGQVKPEFLRELARRVPLVFSVGGLPLPELDCVTVDFRGAAQQAVQYLIGLGHRKIAFIGGSSSVGMPYDQEERFIGYRMALESNGLPAVREWIQDGGFNLAQSYEAMIRILQAKERPTALFAASDKMAYGAYKAIQEYGLSIPGDISVVSFDDIEMSEFVNPSLTTFRVYKEEMGRIAVKLLMQRMEGQIPLPLVHLLPTRLMIRDSCRKLEAHS